MHKKQMCSIALRVAYHLGQKLVDLHAHPLHTLSMMVTAFIMAGGPWLSQMARHLAHLPGSVHEKVSRMSRFLCQSEFDLTDAFHQVARRIVETVAVFHPRKKVLVAMDWTDLGEYMGLWLSLPYQGRALPLSCVVLEKEKSEEAMTDMELELVERFLGLFSPEIRSRVVILADRGFAKRELFDKIEQLGGHYGIRLPRNRHIRQQGAWVELKELKLKPGQTRMLRSVEYLKENPRKVHLAARRLAEGKANDPEDDVWYIATDDGEELDSVLSWYAKRFSCEEMFRDLKGRLNMERHQLKTEESVGKMMLIVALAYLVILEDGTQWRSQVDKQRIHKTTGWGKLSVFRTAEICFDLCLPEAPESQVNQAVISRWNRRQVA